MDKEGQWKRMASLNPLSRPRTPQTSTFEVRPKIHISNSEELDIREFNGCTERNSSSASLNLLFAPLPEATHSKRHGRPKFLARASQYFTSSGSGKNHHHHDRFSQSFEDPQRPKEIQTANIDVIVDTIFQRIATHLGQPLSAQNNEPILKILEAYRDMREAMVEQNEKLTKAVTHNNTTLDTLEGERNRWKEDEANYKAEIKRLEVIIAQGRTGLSEVALARQQSLLRRRRPTRFATTTGIESNVKVGPTVDKALRKSEPLLMDASTWTSHTTLTNRPIPHWLKPAFPPLEKRLPDVGGLMIVQRGAQHPVSPSRKMTVLSQSIQAADTTSYLDIDLPIGTPPRKDEGVSLANVELPPQWARPDDPGAWARSQSSAKSGSFPSDSLFDDDLSSSGGDLLPDEIDQQVLTSHAIDHVSRLIAEAKGCDVHDIVEILEASMMGDSDINSTDNPPTPRTTCTTSTSSRASISPQRTFQDQQTPVPQNLAKRRKIDVPHIDTDNITPCRPFSFFAGDDRAIRSAPAEVIDIARSYSQASCLRDKSMIPSPVLDYPLARARREDSNSSLMTSFQRSPCEHSGFMMPRTPSGASSRISVVTAVRQTSGRGGQRLVSGLSGARNKAAKGESE